MSTTTSSHAYGIGVIALIIGMGAVIVFYTSFWLPESLEKPSVDIHILEPTENFIIRLVLLKVQQLKAILVMFQIIQRLL